MSGVLVNGTLIHYEILGRGDPIVFVHGWLGSWRYWIPVMENLGVGHRTYALDLWGFGDSDKAQEHYDVQAYVEMLAAFLDAMGMGRVPLVGHTLGGVIATKLAALHPDRLSKVLAAGLPLSAEAINRKLLSVGSNESLARLFWQRQKPYAEVEIGLSKMARNALALTIESVARLDLRETLEEMMIPLLAVYGEKDPVIDAGQADELESERFAARAIVLPEAYHFPMLEQTARFTRLLRDFMDVQDTAGLQDLAIKEEWRRRTR